MRPAHSLRDVKEFERPSSSEHADCGHGRTLIRVPDFCVFYVYAAGMIGVWLQAICVYAISTPALSTPALMQAENIRGNVRQIVGCDVIAYLPEWYSDSALPQAALTTYLQHEAAMSGSVVGEDEL